MPLPYWLAFPSKGFGRPPKNFGLKGSGARLISNVTRTSRAERHRTNTCDRSRRWWPDNPPRALERLAAKPHGLKSFRPRGSR
jgi:hypothetical protein